MLKFSAPSSLRGMTLEEELSVAGFEATVLLVGDEIEVHGVGPSDEGAVRTVVEAHNPSPVLPPPSETERLQAQVDSLQAAADSQLTDTLMVFDALITAGLL